MLKVTRVVNAHLFLVSHSLRCKTNNNNNAYRNDCAIGIFSRHFTVQLDRLGASTYSFCPHNSRKTLVFALRLSIMSIIYYTPPIYSLRTSRYFRLHGMSAVLVHIGAMPTFFGLVKAILLTGMDLDLESRPVWI